jgi:septal ring-binding cell division protein DamX
MRAGKVSREHVKQALAKRKESETLGDALLNLGFITRKELTWSRRVQVVGVIRSIAAWTDGSFTIVADYLPKRDEGTLFPLPQVLVELIVTEQDRAQFERALDSGEAVFTKTGDFEEVWRKLGLNEDAEAIAVEIDGTKNATEVATASGRDTFNVYKLLHALATLGVLARAPKPQADSQFSLDEDFATAGVADAADVWNNPESDLTDADFAAELPAFDLDDDAVTTVQAPMPTLEMETPPAPSAWDEADEVPLDLSLDTTTPTPKVPVWQGQNGDQIGDQRMVAVPPPVKEPEWGFDDAQLETARAATAAAPRASRVSAAPVQKKKKSGSRYGLLIALLVIAILGAAGYFGFRWWQGRQEATPTLVARQPVAPPTTTTTAPPPTETAAPVPASLTVTPTPVPTTTTVAPPPATASIEPAPTQALPRVTARTTTAAASPAAAPGRERIDAMARDFAANTSGNFTVQIQILCDASNVEKLMRDGGPRVWFVPQTIGGTRSCYRVFWGRYNTREQAQQALAQIPAGVRDRSAAVKPVPKG